METAAWIFICLAALLVLADFAYRCYASRRIKLLLQDVPVFAAAVRSPDIVCERIVVPSSDGIRLSGGIYHPEGDPAGVVLFCPELHGTLATAMTYAQALPDAGFAVVSFEFSSQGTSDRREGYRPLHWVSEFEVQDIQSVVTFIRSHEVLGGLPLGIMGVSRGASAALIAAQRDPQLKSIYSDSGYSTMLLIRHFMTKFSRYVVPDWFFNRLPAWHVDVVLRQALRLNEKESGCRFVHLEKEISIAARTARTITLVSGSRDSYVPPAVTEELGRLLGCKDRVHIFPRAKHNRSRETDPVRYDRLLVGHFTETLLADRTVDPSGQSPRQP